MCDNLELPGIASFWHDGLLTTLKENEDWEIYLDRTLYLTIPKGILKSYVSIFNPNKNKPSFINQISNNPD